MASYDTVRMTGLLVKTATATLYGDSATLYGIVSQWNLTGEDVALPLEGDVKQGVLDYEAIEKPSLSSAAALQEIKASTEPGSPAGIYNLPLTASSISFSVAGPVPLGLIGSAAVGASMRITRIALLCLVAGDSDLVVDLRKNDVSLFDMESKRPTIAYESVNAVDITDSVDLNDTTLTASDILSVYVTNVDDTCRDIDLRIWISPL